VKTGYSVVSLLLLITAASAQPGKHAVYRTGPALQGMISAAKPTVVPIDVHLDSALPSGGVSRRMQQGSAVVLARVVSDSFKACALTCTHIFFFDRSGGHWLRPATDATLRLNLADGTSAVARGRLIMADTLHDVALVALAFRKLTGVHLVGVPPSGWFSAESLREGDAVLYIGYPMGLGIDSSNFPLSRTGTVAQLTDDRSRFIIDGFVQAGHSGSPVFVRHEGTAPEGSFEQLRLCGIVTSYRPEIISEAGQDSLSVQTNPGFTTVVALDAVLPRLRAFFNLR